MHEHGRAATWTRGLAALLLLFALSVAVASGAQEIPGVETFRSEPGILSNALAITATADGTAPGYLFLGPRDGEGQNGPTIVDDQGEVVWFQPLEDPMAAMEFRVQEYEGEPVLTWWEGEVLTGYGEGEYVIADSSYEEIARFEAGNGRPSDFHEYMLTASGTALVTIYDREPRDLSSVGGPEDGEVLESVIQEIDVDTGEVVFEWSALDHVDMEESYFPVPEDPEKPWDHFHINSVDIDDDGNLLVSARHTRAVYKIDRESGRIIWRLGGKESDFEMGPGTTFTGQHDARRLPDGTISIYDNAAPPPMRERSRAIVLDVDEVEMTATLDRQYEHPADLLADSQGNAQTLDGGHVLVGWGSEPWVTEYTEEGRMVFDARFPGGAESYRAYRLPWEGRPETDPAIAAEGEVTVYASWNGATEVARWQVLAGPSPDELEPVGVPAPRDGFETAIEADTDEPFVAVEAVDEAGEALGRSEAVEPEG